LTIVLVAFALRTGSVSAYLWVAAYVPLFSVVALTFTNHLGYFPIPWLPYNATLYAVLLETPLLLLALHLHAKTLHEQAVRKSTLDSTDPMTGFVPSALFPAKLALVWNTNRKARHELAVAYIAVSTVSWNTAAPDQMRARVVRMLRTVVHDRDNVAHVDKDIYAIILPNIALGDNLSAVLSRLIALGAMQDKTALDHAPIAFRIVASTQSSFAGTAQELHEAMRKKLLDSKGWSRRAIRFVTDTHNAKSSQSSEESFSAFWQRAHDSSKEDSAKD
jgi:GGDEF domain-containing protein